MKMTLMLITLKAKIMLMKPKTASPRCKETMMVSSVIKMSCKILTMTRKNSMMMILDMARKAQMMKMNLKTVLMAWMMMKKKKKSNSLKRKARSKSSKKASKDSQITKISLTFWNKVLNKNKIKRSRANSSKRDLLKVSILKRDRPNKEATKHREFIESLILIECEKICLFIN